MRARSQAPHLERRPHERPWPTLADDTDPAVEAVQLAIYREMSPAAKVRIWDDLVVTGWALALAGLRSRHPRASAAELQRRLADLQVGEDLAREAYGPGPDER